MTQSRSNQTSPLVSGPSCPPPNLMQEAEKAYEETVHAMLMPSGQAERERFLFSLGYMAGKDAVLTRLANKTAPFSTQ